MEPVPWFYVGAGAGLAVVVWSAIRPPWSARRTLHLAIGTLIASALATFVLLSLNPENGLGPYAGSCVANLREIQNAKAAWALELRRHDDVPQDSDLFVVGKLIQSKPICPDGGNYWLGAGKEKPECSLVGPEHCLQDPPRKHFKDDASAAAFFVVCGLAFVAFLQALRGAGQATLHNGQCGQVLVLSALALILALGVLLALPNFVNARASGSVNVCAVNLHTIQRAKEAWATENHKPRTAIPTESDLFGPGRFIVWKLVCPSYSSAYYFGAVNEKPICSRGGAGHRWEYHLIRSAGKIRARNLASFLFGLSLFAAVPVLNRAWESRRRRRPPGNS